MRRASGFPTYRLLILVILSTRPGSPAATPCCSQQSAPVLACMNSVNTTDVLKCSCSDVESSNNAFIQPISLILQGIAVSSFVSYVYACLCSHMLTCD